MLGGGPATKEEGGGKYFVKPTIFTGVNNKMRIAQEEVFGPVLSVIKFKDEDEAVRIANDIAYGLGAGVWTQSVKRAHTHGGAHQGRHRVGEHLPGGELPDAVRRLQGLGPRPRERRGGDRGLSAVQERVDQQWPRRRQPVRDEDGIVDLDGAAPAAKRLALRQRFCADLQTSRNVVRRSLSMPRRSISCGMEKSGVSLASTIMGPNSVAAMSQPISGTSFRAAAASSASSMVSVQCESRRRSGWRRYRDGASRP